MAQQIETLHCPQKNCDFVAEGFHAVQGLSSHIRLHHHVTGEAARKLLAKAKENAAAKSAPAGEAAANAQVTIDMPVTRDFPERPRSPIDHLRDAIAISEAQVTRLRAAVNERLGLEEELRRGEREMAELQGTLTRLTEAPEVAQRAGGS